jgi:hypothetical protein
MENYSAMINDGRFVTIWYRDDGSGTEFNHISLGWFEAQLGPAYVNENQRKAWKKCVWVAKRGVLREGIIFEEEKRQN